VSDDGDPRAPTLADQLAQFGAPRFTPYDEEKGAGLEVRYEPSYSRVIPDGEYAAPSAAATHEYGVLFRADHETFADGMCRQARAHASVLAQQVPLLLASINGKVRRPVFDEDGTQIGVQTFSLAGDDMLEDEVFEEVGQLRRTSIRNYLAVMYHTVIRSAEQLRSLVLPEYTRAAIGAADRLLARTVIYTPWERSTVSPEIIEAVMQVGQMWLQCSRNVDAFVSAGLPKEKVRLIPPAFDPSGPVAQIPKTRTKVPSGKRFYNIGKWEPRKAQHELLGAFLMAFSPGDAASLTMKVSYFGEWDGYPSHRETLGVWLSDRAVRARGWTPENVARQVAIYDKQFTDGQMTKLHELHNIYVSASHAEGWDYPAFDAKTAGNRLVHVGFGGSEDYCDVTDVRVPFSLGPVDPQYGWEPDAQWADYRREDLVRALSTVTPRQGVETVTDFAAHYGAPVIGRQMFDALRHLILGAEPALWDTASASWRQHAD